jgi:RNA polymerase sigma factor (sigma-70 family)
MRIGAVGWPKKTPYKNGIVVADSSAQLVERYRQGDPQAADELFARYVERLTEMVRWQLAPMLRRRIDPEDAVHSAYRSFFVRARNGRFVLERSGDLWKLLVTITLNKLRRQIVHHRAQKRAVQRDRPLDESILLGEIAGGPSPLEALAAADELESFMVRLNPLERHILELRLQEKRWNEIAAATGRSERTVRRALERIQLLWQSESQRDWQEPPGVPRVRSRA